MERIAGLVKLGFSDVVPMNSTAIFQFEGARSDILRTVIVFLHATFEDVLRTIARQRLALAESRILDNIPLVGISKSGRPEKFSLGALHAHREKTVDQLIQESVERYLDKESFNSSTDVAVILRQMGIDPSHFDGLYPYLDQMMRKRHRIVHEADLASPKDSASPPWSMLGDSLNLLFWLFTVMTFYAQICVLIDPTDEVTRLYGERWRKAIDRTREICDEIVALRNVPADSYIVNLQEATARLSELTAFLGRPTMEEMLVIWKRMKSPDDGTTEDEARANLASICRDDGK